MGEGEKRGREVRECRQETHILYMDKVMRVRNVRALQTYPTS